MSINANRSMIGSRQRWLSCWLAATLLIGAAAAPIAAQEAAQDTDRSRRGDISARGDLVIAEGETARDVIVYGGTLRVLGRITGDAAVFGGDLVLGEGSEVEGNVMIAGGELIDEGGRVRGEMRIVDDARALAREIEGESVADRHVDDEVRREIRAAMDEAGRDRAVSPPSRFERVRSSVLGMISALALGLVLAGAGAALVFYGRPYLETVSDTARASVLRAGAVGLAASFLAIPGLIILTVVLAVSIIGIPLLLALPLYPLAFIAATAFGLVGVAHAIGERTAEQRNTSYDLKHRNSYAYVFTGLAMFTLPWIAAELLRMTPFLGFVSILLKIVLVFAVIAASWVGLGAVILSRAGTRRTFAAPPAPVDLDADPLFDREPTLRGTDV